MPQAPGDIARARDEVELDRLRKVVAEELEVDWKDIRIDYPTSDPKHGLMITGGSWSVNWTFDKLSRAAVAARTMLIDAAAQQWKVPASECVADRSTVRHAPTGRFLTYGQIVDKVPIATRTWSEDDLKKLTLKRPEEYRVVGHWASRLDIPDKVNGKAKFGIDTFLPGMLYAKVAYPPTREGAKVKAVDDKAAKGVKGYVKTVVAGDLVAALGTTYEAAVQARDALKVTWDNGPNAAVSTESITRDYEQKAKDDTTSPAWVEKGDVKSALGQAAKTHEATYLTDYVAHAPLEPMNCLAKFEGGVADIYTGCQFQTMAMGAIAKQLGVKEDKVRVHQQYLGGGFGRRLEPDAIVEAVVIAREAGKPVKLIRSREEDFKRDYFRSFTLQRLRGGLDAQGKLTAWDNTLVAAYPGERYAGLDDKGRDQFALNGADHVYDIPNQFVRAIRKETGISVGYVRAVAPNYTFFAVETFIDELAQVAKADAVQFRLGAGDHLRQLDELGAEPQSYVSRVTALFGIERIGLAEKSHLSDETNSFARAPRNRKLARRATAVKYWLRGQQAYRVVDLLERAGVWEFCGGRGEPFPKLTPEQDARLRARFLPEVEALEELLMMDLSAWKKPRVARRVSVERTSIRAEYLRVAFMAVLGGLLALVPLRWTTGQENLYTWLFGKFLPARKHELARPYLLHRLLPPAVGTLEPSAIEVQVPAHIGLREQRHLVQVGLAADDAGDVPRQVVPDVFLREHCRVRGWRFQGRRCRAGCPCPGGPPGRLRSSW